MNYGSNNVFSGWLQITRKAVRDQPLISCPAHYPVQLSPPITTNTTYNPTAGGRSLVEILTVAVSPDLGMK
jgi:hypothetical protein